MNDLDRMRKFGDTRISRTKYVIALLLRGLEADMRQVNWLSYASRVECECAKCDGVIAINDTAHYAVVRGTLDGPYCDHCQGAVLKPMKKREPRVPTRHGGFQNAKGVEEIEKWKATANEVWRGRQDDEQEIEDEEFEDEE
jgi:hypothetical protein